MGASRSRARETLRERNIMSRRTKVHHKATVSFTISLKLNTAQEVKAQMRELLSSIGVDYHSLKVDNAQIEDNRDVGNYRRNKR